MAEDNAKLSSLFSKKKKKSTTVNANVIAKEQSRAESAAAVAKSAASTAAAAAASAAAAARPQSPKSRAKGKPATSSPAGGPSAAPVKNLSELTLGDKQEKSAFQWAKQPKKYKDTADSKVRDGKCTVSNMGVLID